MNINNVTLNKFRKEFQEVVKDLETRHGIKVNMGPITYGPDEFRFKTTVLKKTQQYTKFTIPVDGEYVGQTFDFNGREYEVIEYKPRNFKYPLIAQNNKGKRYKFPLSVIIEK